jgi:hypothetical protein
MNIDKLKGSIFGMIIGDSMGNIVKKIKLPNELHEYYDYPIVDYRLPMFNKYIDVIGGQSYLTLVFKFLVISYITEKIDTERIQKFKMMLYNHVKSKNYKIGEGDVLYNIIINDMITNCRSNLLISNILSFSQIHIIIAMFCSLLPNSVEYLLKFNKYIFYSLKEVNIITINWLLYFRDNLIGLNGIDVLDKFTSNQCNIEFINAIIDIINSCNDFDGSIIKSINDYPGYDERLSSIIGFVFGYKYGFSSIKKEFITNMNNNIIINGWIDEFIKVLR